MSHQHERRVCSCGQIILQCRCIGPKLETVVPNGCPSCQARFTEQTFTIRASDLVPRDVDPLSESDQQSIRDGINRCLNGLRAEFV